MKMVVIENENNILKNKELNDDTAADTAFISD